LPCQDVFLPHLYPLDITRFLSSVWLYYHRLRPRAECVFSSEDDSRPCFSLWQSLTLIQWLTIASLRAGALRYDYSYPMGVSNRVVRKPHAVHLGETHTHTSRSTH